jgi:hypothetical protein
MNTDWIVPVCVLFYLFLVFYLSLYMAKILDTNYVLLVLVGVIFPPIWIIMALVALVLQEKIRVISPKKSPGRPRKVKK